MRLADSCALHGIVAARLRVPTDKGANASGKVAAIVADMVTGADAIDDLDLLRHGGMPTLFDGLYAPSTLGSFLRAFSHGHVRQLQAASRQFLVRLAGRARLLPGSAAVTFVGGNRRGPHRGFVRAGFGGSLTTDPAFAALWLRLRHRHSELGARRLWQCPVRCRRELGVLDPCVPSTA